MKRLLSVILVLCCAAAMLCGCSTITDAVGEAVGEAVDAALNAAVETLKEEFQEQLETYGVQVVETKTAIGEIKSGEGKLQFFCAVLIKTNNLEALQEADAALAGKFEHHGYFEQTGPEVQSEYLENKTITYDTDPAGEEGYYTFYLYLQDASELELTEDGEIDLESIVDLG